MPNYEYLCKNCGHRFEQIRKFSDKPLRKCPECGGVIEQVISGRFADGLGNVRTVPDRIVFDPFPHYSMARSIQAQSCCCTQKPMTAAAIESVARSQ